MPFPLGDLKRSYGRSGSRGPDVRPYLLTGKELETQRPQLRAAIEWYAAHVGKRRAELSDDEFATLIGDYRFARCLAACLHTSFDFQPEPQAAEASAARLALFDAVNEQADGFAPPEQRQALLANAAARMRLPPDEIESVLWSDAPERDRLTQVGPSPTVEELAAQYNRRALETLLVRALSADLFLRSPDGAAIRRLYFAVKRAGLLCELSLQEPDAGAAGGVWAHLFSPLEVFGPRTRHGDRFARAVLELTRAFPDLEGSARVLVNEREYELRLPRGAASPPFAAVEFDSSIERHLYETLRGMERTADTRDWTVQREPEPIVHGATVLVPDFALSRPGTEQDDPRRVYVEVIGFWTPEYRERKKAKLLALAGSVDLVLVVQEELAPFFSDLPYELLPYKRRPAARDLILLLERAYPRKAPRRRLKPQVVPAPEETRAEWEALFGIATASASPAAPGTPDAG
ncbi:MAG TPA: DUF790 family protein [Chloroflexota bacterium]|nr:DUF790 family protein [Chloroflexota bacterium]